MENSIYIGLSRQVALRSQLDLIANNVANMSTPGYRAQSMIFSEFLNKSPANPDVPVKDDISQVLDYGHYQNTESGPTKQTGNPTDVALNGPGYFGIQTPEGVLYTRAGNFQLNANGQIVTGSGDPVVDQGGGEIVIPEESTEIRIDRKGVIANQDGEIAQLMIVEFANEQQLEATGRGLYRTPEGVQPAEAENTVAMQGMLEGSNVNPIMEMTRMIEAARSYQSTQRMLTDEHDRQRDMIGRLTQGN